jgi:hypothetical protein
MESLRDKLPRKNEIFLAPKRTRFAVWVGSFDDYEIYLPGLNRLGELAVATSI